MPETTVTDDRDGPSTATSVKGRVGCRSQTVAHRGATDLERCQTAKKVTTDVTRDLQRSDVILRKFHRRKDGPFGTTGTETGWSDRHAGSQSVHRGAGCRQCPGTVTASQQHVRGMTLKKFADPGQYMLADVLTCRRQDVLAGQVYGAAGLVKNRCQSIFDVGGLALLDHQDRLLALTKSQEFRIDQGVGHIQHVQRNPTVAEDVGEPEAVQRPDHTVVHATLHDDANRPAGRTEDLVQALTADEFHCRRPALIDFFLFVRIGGRRQNDTVCPAARRVQRFAHSQRWSPVITCRERAIDVTGTDPELQHHRCVGRLRKFESVCDRLDDRGQVGSRVQQPDL